MIEESLKQRKSCSEIHMLQRVDPAVRFDRKKLFIGTRPYYDLHFVAKGSKRF